MPINRSVWIDDDGSGTTGTILNNAELQKIYDNIDAFGNGTPKVLTVTDSGVLHNWTPAGFGPVPIYIVWAGTAQTELTGIAAGYEGQIITIRNYVSPILQLWNMDSGSVAANRIECAVTSGRTPIALKGMVQLIYNAGLWRLIHHEQGAWITDPFNAGAYSGPTATWTVTAAQERMAKYRLTGRTLNMVLDVYESTLSASTTGQRLLPGGYTAAPGYCPQPAPSAIYAGVAGLGYIVATGGALLIMKDALSASMPAGQLSIFAAIALEVQ